MGKLNKNQPPEWVNRIFDWYCRKEYADEIRGDLLELYEKWLDNGKFRANIKYVLNVILFMRMYNMKMNSGFNINQLGMYKNYFKIYFRKFRLDITHYLVNILGLSLGFAILVFVLIYAHSEQKIDNHHKKSNRIYRVLETSNTPKDGIVHYANTSHPLAVALKQEFPAIEQTARFISDGAMNLRYEDRIFQDRNYIYASKSLFDILDFEVTKGNTQKPFNGLVGVVLSETMSKKLFLDEDPIGKIIELRGFKNAEVIAVIKDMSTNSSYKFNMILVTEFDRLGAAYNVWHSGGMTTLVLMKENTKVESILAGKDEFMLKYYEEEVRSQHDFSFQKYSDTHLHSTHLIKRQEPYLAIPYSSTKFLSLIILIGFFVMTIATLNFVNLSSVQILRRLQDVAVRKVNGATKGQLRLQLITETFLTMFLAYIIMLALVFLSFNQFLKISQKQIGFDVLISGEMIIYQLIVFISIWVLSSMIPARYYSKLKLSPAGTSKNKFSGKGDTMRKVFVVVQYCVSFLLITGSIVLYLQMDYVSSKDLGFNSDNLITWDINSDEALRNAKNIVRELSQSPLVVNATSSSRVPGEWKYIHEVDLSFDKNQKLAHSRLFAIDEFWLKTFNINLNKGSNFTGISSSDTLKVILNETAVEKLGIADPLGRSILVSGYGNDYPMQIIGVTNDFHIASLYEAIEPVILVSSNNPLRNADYFTIKHNGNMAEVINHIKDIQSKFDPNTAAELHFLDEQLNRFYRAEQSRSTLISIASFLSIIISAFGLFGLVNFTVERRIKEIGIRKILGASLTNLIYKLLKDYVVLLIISVFIAFPIAYWALSNWLEKFAYRVQLSPTVFVIALILVMFISFGTVISRVYKTAKENPINGLRQE